MPFGSNRGNQGSVPPQAGQSFDPTRVVLSILRDQAYNKMLAVLKNIVKTEVKRTDANGKETVDYASTVSAIKTKAQQTIEDVEGYDKYLNAGQDSGNETY